HADGAFLSESVFDTSGGQETVGGVGGMDFTKFEIALKLTLDVARTVNESGAERTVVDAMSWVAQIEAMDPATRLLEETALIEKYIHVSVPTTGTLDPGGSFRSQVRDKLYNALTDKDVMT